MEKACGLHCTKINNIGVKIGNEVILKDVSIHIHCGELTVIIGRMELEKVLCSKLF